MQFIRTTRRMKQMYGFFILKFMAEHNNLGAWGENVATEYLIEKGYAITERNFKAGRYELDIIAMDGDEIVFVEVKTRIDNFADPSDAVDEKKIRHLAKAADIYLRMRKYQHAPRFDVITVTGSETGGYSVTHYPDAFMPPLMTGGSGY